MSNSDLVNHAKHTISRTGFFRSGILQICAGPLLCLILAMGLWYWTISKIDTEKRAGEKKVLQEASALCNDYAHYLAQAIEQANQITLQLQYGWEQSHGNLPLPELSQGGLFRNPWIVNVLILNREGMSATTILGKSQNVSYADRDYFIYHKNDDSNALLIGKPLVSRSTGKPAITFSRRLNTPHGAFDGVALVAFDPPYLTAFNAGSFPGKTGLLMVAGLDGTLRSATIGNATQDPKSAALRAVPLFNSPEGASYLSGEQWFGDKLSRYVAWKTLEEYPLVAMVGLSEQEYFAPYQKTWATDRTVAISGSIILFLFASAAAGISTRLVRKKYLEEEVMKAYRAELETSNKELAFQNVEKEKRATELVIANKELAFQNEEKEKRAAELVVANASLESFSYSISHDLRAPLRSIDGFSLALLEDYEDKLDEGGKDYLRRVRSATQKMAQLIDDILKLSRITRAELTMESVKLSELAGSIADELSSAEPGRKVAFVITKGLTTWGDSALLKVVLDNLIGNAWKFTGSHTEARIEFGSAKVDGKTAYFIRDDGAGFDPKYVDKLFVTFQRLHTEAEFPGTGIGLSLVQHIIQRHGGRVWAEGAVDRGATFWFTVGG